MNSSKYLMLLVVLLTGNIINAQNKPNIILVMMDDVGYGDLSCNGSPVIKTPNLDKLYSESVRLTNYHSGTTCAPTRASLLTGQHYNKIGVWHTINGRSLLRPGIITLPEALAKNGYHTAMFGKWHLGDNYPMRPEDRGFQYTVAHGGGGVGQTPDYWGNDYFDDTYFKNGKPKKFNGYCTDVWFDESIKFIEQKVNEKNPFFCYIALNAAHSPHRAPQKYIDKYKDNPAAIDPVYNAMVDNIDDNMGKLLSRLDELNISNNTIVIFTSDNGTSNRAGIIIDKDGFVTQGFNAGMRGTKAQVYEGGHRVPFLIRYPESSLKAGTDVNQLSSCQDILPTLLNICGITDTLPDIDGETLLPYLEGKPIDSSRIYIADTQRDRYLKKYNRFSVMKGAWRLIGDALYDLRNDPEQRNNITEQFPGVANELKNAYESWWTTIENENKKYPFIRIPIAENVITPLNCMDMFPDEDGKQTSWNQEFIKKEKNVVSGSWKLTSSEAGLYRITIQQLPVEAPRRSRHIFETPGSAYVRINNSGAVVKENITTKKATFFITLPEGDIDLWAGFSDRSGHTVAAQFAYIKKVR